MGSNHPSQPQLVEAGREALVRGAWEEARSAFERALHTGDRDVVKHTFRAVLDLEPVNETAGFTQSGILGGNFLRHFRIYFDFARGAMRLESLNQKPKSVDIINPEVVLTP